jgi:uncharacterized protein YbjT (DUF2867 family)
VKALVIGGTGRVGSAVVHHLRECGVDTIVAARRPPAGGVSLDLRDPTQVEAQARGFSHAFFATPLGPDEGEVGVAAAAALRRAGVSKLVHLGIMSVDAMREISHFATKIPIRDAVLGDGNGVIVSANFFFQNDLLVLPAILNMRVYPLPIGSAGVWSVDTHDIGRAAARALMRDDWNGRAVPVCGREKLTGPMLAECWSRALGQSVIYPGNAIEPFIAGMRAVIPGFGEWEAHDFATMMRVTQEQGCPATFAEIAEAEAIIGRPQRLHADFIADTLAAQGDAA